MKHHHFPFVFLALAAAYIYIHYYSAAWLARAFSAGPEASRWLRTGFLLLALLSPLTMFLRHRLHHPAMEPFYLAAFAWMGAIVVISFVFFAGYLVATAAGFLKFRLPPWYGHAVAAAAVLCVAWGLRGGMAVPPVKRVTLEIKDLPRELDGFRIAQVSDMHLDSSWQLKKFRKAMEEVNAEKPDLIAFTGDLIDPGVTCLDEVANIAHLAAAKHPPVGVFGNHEYYFGADRAAACYETFGIRLLRNSHLDAGPLRVVGVGDIMASGLSKEEFRAVLEKGYKKPFSLLLSHQPLMLEEAGAAGSWAVLSGHVHRGQIFPFGFVTWLAYRNFYGIYRSGGAVMYVTSGAGTWGPPLRWLAPAEIPLITLKRAGG